MFIFGQIRNLFINDDVSLYRHDCIRIARGLSGSLDYVIIIRKKKMTFSYLWEQKIYTPSIHVEQLNVVGFRTVYVN